MVRSDRRVLSGSTTPLQQRHWAEGPERQRVQVDARGGVRVEGGRHAGQVRQLDGPRCVQGGSTVTRQAGN